MKSKKIRSLFCAAALTLSLAACGSKTSDCSGQTITGEITDIDGTAVTMPPAKPDSQSGSTDSQPPEMPSGQDSSSNSQSGDSGRQPPEKPDGEAPSGSAPRRHGRQQLYRGRGECDARLRECGNYKK